MGKLGRLFTVCFLVCALFTCSAATATPPDQEVIMFYLWGTIISLALLAMNWIARG
jgi:hypothetical protein